MATFTVHHRDRQAAAILQDADSVAFVREGFSWTAFAVPLLWFAAHGLWLVLVLYLAAIGILTYAGELAGLSDPVGMATGLGVHLLVGFEAGNLRRWTLRRRGLRDIAVVSGASLHDAELRFFEALIGEGQGGFAPPPDRAPTPPVTAVPTPAPAPMASANPAAIFPEPGGLR